MAYCSRRCLAFLLVAVIAGGCKKDAAVNEKKAADPSPAPAREKYLVAAEPSGAQGVLDVRKDAKDGDDVTIVGRVGGSKKPQVADAAVFTIVDPFKFKPCNEGDDTGCPTPWDYCCDAKEDLRKGTATIKIVDEQGKIAEAQYNVRATGHVAKLRRDLSV